MCLVKVRQEEDVMVPVRVVRRDRSPRRSHHSVRRVSRTEIIHDSPRHSHSHSASYVAVPSPGPKPLAIPPPQPVPVFYEPPPAPIPPPSVSHHSHQAERAHYVEVSPASSVTSVSRSHAPSEYVVHEREYRRQRREREYSDEERSPRYEHFRYVDGPGSESDYGASRRSKSRMRERSVSRGRYEEPYGERVTRERVSVHIGDGRRSRDYR